MAENVAVKLVKKDNLLGYNSKGHLLYSNQFIPLITEASLFDRIRLQGKFDEYLSGGSILHVNCETEIKDDKVYQNLIEYCVKNGVIYWSPVYTIQECEQGHISVGKETVCPTCGSNITNKYQKVVGFITKVSSWSKERREIDFPARKFYKELSVDENSKDAT